MSAPSIQIKVEPLAPAHVAPLAALAARVPTAPHWPPSEYARLIEVAGSRPGRRGAWIAGIAQEPVLGFAIASHAAGLAELEAVVTAPERRRLGIGTALLRAVLAWAEQLEAERIALEVRASNLHAIRLYSRLGFRQDGVRRGYYHRPEEDALLMSLLLGSPLAG